MQPLTLTNLTLSDDRLYNVVVTNAAGGVISAEAALRVWIPSSVVAWAQTITTGYSAVPDECNGDMPVV